MLTPPSSSLYTIQGVTGSTYKETEPLLRGQNDIESEPDSRVVNKKCISKDTLKTFLTAVCLWLAYLFVSADYSLLAPFFPGEVIISIIVIHCLTIDVCCGNFKY